MRPECLCEVGSVTIKEVDFSTTSEAKRRTRLLSNHEVTVTAEVDGASSDEVANALNGAEELGGAMVEEIKVEGGSGDDDGALGSHLSVAALLLSMVAALAA